MRKSKSIFPRAQKLKTFSVLHVLACTQRHYQKIQLSNSMTIFETPPPPLSLHIPRIDTRNLGKSYRDLDFVHSYVKAQFHRHRVGQVHHVDLIPRKNHQGYLYYEAFVHFSKWFDNTSSLALRRAACSPLQRATLPLPNNRHFWVINENNNSPLVEDFQSILSSIPVALWQQAADETEAWQYWNAQQEDAVLERWYDTPPTDEQLDAVALIERTWLRAHGPPPAPRKTAAKKTNKPWACDTCAREEIPGDPSTEPYAGNTCGRCAHMHWDC